MSDEKPKSPPPRTAPGAPGGPPRLERVPPGHTPPGVRPPPAGAAPPRVSTPGAAPSPRPAFPVGAGAERPVPPSTPGGASSHGLAPREVGADAAIAAGLTGEGPLSSESALRVFALAAAAQATGRLEIAAAARTFALTFRRGTVEHAASTDPADDLGAFLVRRGKLSEDQRALAEAKKGAARGDLAAALVAERLVNPADAAALLAEHGTAIVQRALAVEAGRWSWTPNAPPPSSAFPLGAPFGMLCAAARALDADAIRRRLGDREHRAASRAVARIRIEDLKLGPQEARAAALLDGTRSPAELVAASPADGAAILRTALLLAELDLVAFGVARTAPSGPSSPVGAPSPRPSSPAAGAPSPRPSPPAGAGGEGAGGEGAGGEGAGGEGAKTAGPLDRAALEALVARLAKADHFDVLGVKREAAAAQIKMAYFQLAKLYHPDAIPVDAAPEVRKLCADVFAKVSAAWAVLGDDAARAQYLDELAHGGAADLDVMRILQAENAFQEATMLVKARRYRDALQKLDEAIGLNADEAEFAMWKGFCEFCLADDKRRKLAATSAAIEAALARNPRCAQGYLFLGQMAKVAGDLALAEKHLKRGLSVAPEHADLQRELKYLRR